jgi:hypothetical protein
MLALFSIFGIWNNLEYRRVQKIVLSLSVASFLIPFHVRWLGLSSSVVYAMSSILVMGLVAIFLASIGSRRLFQCFLFLVGLRFLILYFQALGGLATTGLGLIVSGALVIGMAVFWNKYRKEITLSVERWAQ